MKESGTRVGGQHPRPKRSTLAAQGSLRGQRRGANCSNPPSPRPVGTGMISPVTENFQMREAPVLPRLLQITRRLHVSAPSCEGSPEVEIDKPAGSPFTNRRFHLGQFLLSLAPTSRTRWPLAAASRGRAATSRTSQTIIWRWRGSPRNPEFRGRHRRYGSADRASSPHASLRNDRIYSIRARVRPQGPR